MASVPGKMLFIFFFMMPSSIAVKSDDWLSRANVVARTLLPGTPEGTALDLYDRSTGLWKNQLGWHHGYTLKTLARFAKCANKHSQFSDTVSAVEAVIEKAWANVGLYTFGDKYDDLMYWTSVWLNMHYFTGNATYLDAARDIMWHQVMNGSSWTSGGAPAKPDAIWRGPHSACGGGALWDKTSGYVNAIANEWLIWNLAQPKLLAGQANTSADEWAGVVWQWFLKSGMINSKGLINDGLNPTPVVPGVKCTNNGDPTWTYNQGVILGGLADYASMLAKMPTQKGPLMPAALLAAASAIAKATVTQLVVPTVVANPEDPATNITVQVLHEMGCAHASDCAGNNEVFKGMFVRFLQDLVDTLEANLDAATKKHSQEFLAFLQNNAESVWQRANANHGSSLPPYFGLLWEGPTPADGDNFYQTASTQSVALDLFTGVACSGVMLPQSGASMEMLQI